ncbi:Protein CASP [Leucoagaricus sp. SymC.cos]|nr:Protein CASP [Leucoagaricus sp. SymC.cos]
MSNETNFSGALSTWRDINLSELQKTLDAQGVEIVENQKESVVGRKALSDKTKEFKKTSDAEKLNAFKGLLKAYQTEIDNLTKRSKASENAFLHVYKILAEAPDPYPLLEAAVDQAVKVAEALEQEAELKRLREENTELKKWVNDFSSVESAKKKLEVKVEQLEGKMDDMIQDKVAQKANELNATYDEKLRNYEERMIYSWLFCPDKSSLEQDLQRQLTLTRNQLKDLRMSNETNQAKLIDHSQRQDQEVVAKLAELDMVAAELEAATSRVATVERRNEILRAEIETMKSGSESSDRQGLEAQVSELETEMERLSRALEQQRSVSTETETATSKKVEEFSRELRKKASEIDQLKQKLKQYHDYDEIKRELEIMKYVEFAGLEDADDGSADDDDLHLPDPNAEKANSQHGKSLEVLLATKNKRILEELTKFRILHGELEASLEASQAQLENATSELEKQKLLNEKLEDDLLSMGSNDKKVNGDGSHTPAEDVLAELDLSKKPMAPGGSGSARSTPVPFTSSADTSILPIVTSQRDRFRQRNAELEEELRKQYQVISELRAEIKSLQADNLKLYEKVRYMQSYREEAGSRPPVSQLDPLPVPSGRDDMSTYRARYEEAMNPFEAFRGREATCAYQNLNPVERGVLVLTRSILGNRRARTFFVCYALFLHLLVMYTTYECTTPSGTQLQKPPRPYGS